MRLHCVMPRRRELGSSGRYVQVPVLCPVRSSGSLKSQPSLLNQPSALFNNPASKGKLFFPSRPKDSAPAAAPPATPAHTPTPPKPPLATAQQPHAAVSDSAAARREAAGSAAAGSCAVDLIAGRKRQRRTRDREVEEGGRMDRQPSIARQPSQLPPQHRTEVYLALVVQVAVVADGGVSSMWCRSLKVAQGVLARAVFRKALELYECGTRPRHLQPLLRMQLAQRQKRAADPG